MRFQQISTKRRGAIIPLVALCLVAILGLVALAIDIGMVAVAKTQAQNAADSAAMAGSRSFNQQTGYNVSTGKKNAVTAAVANKIFASKIKGDPNVIANPSADVYTSGDVRLEFGGYYFVYDDVNPSNEGFKQAFPPTVKPAAEPYTAVRATITTTSPIFFGKVFGANPFSVKATAVGAHRPRDVVIIMDLSGSMRFQSCPGGYLNGLNLTANSAPRNKSLNPDTLIPTWGHYASASAALVGNTSYPTGSGEQVDPANITATSISGPPVIPDFMTSGSTLAFAYDSAKDAYATTPGGDNYLGATVKTVTDYVTATPTITALKNYERGTTGYGATVKGYTEGPGYWGKTFFVWPPDPRGSDLDANVAANHADNGAKDWRQRFFFKKTGTTLYWLDHNNILFDPAGTPGTSSATVTPIMKTPQTTTSVTENGVSVSYRYCINYAAIFQWLRNSAPTHFPASMTTGRINFYSSIPNPTGDNSFNDRFWTQHPMTNISERFWKDYVDFMLGQVATAANTYDNNYSNAAPYTACIGPGDMFAWGTVQVKQRADCDYLATVNNSGGYASGYTGTLSFNNVKTLAGTAIDLPGPNPVTGYSTATPAVVTSLAHGLVVGNTITVQGVTGTGTINTLANNVWTILTAPTADTFTVSRPITGYSTATPAVLTSVAHGLTVGDTIVTQSIAGSGTIATVANRTWTIATAPTPDTFTVSRPITGVSTAPTTVITSVGHLLATGDKVVISGVVGTGTMTKANNTWTVTKLTADTFSLQGSVALTGTYTANTGVWSPGNTATYTANSGSWSPGNTATYSANTGSWTPAITAATNTTPIVITTGAPHLIPATAPNSGKFTLNLTGITGNTAANGVWIVTRTGANTFSLDGSTGNGAFTSNKNQWWEPVYYVRFGYNSTYHELNPALVSVGTLTATPDIALPNAVTNGSTVKIYTMTPKFMDYADNPYRPKHQFWFGPMTFVDWLGNYTINKLRWPGNVHEAQAWACKVGISASIDDIKNNHPNDYVGMTFFSSPSTSTAGGGQHNQAVIPLGREYQKLKDSLWFPPSTVSGAATTITPYDADFVNVPRANGSTAPCMGFMIAYNLLSSATTNLRTYATPEPTYRGYAGGLGRKGATRLIIFETDGAPNSYAYKAIVSSGANSYYPIRLKDPQNISTATNEFPNSGTYADTEVFDVVKQICALDSASVPGYSTTRKPALVYSIGYGSLFDAAHPSSYQTTAMTFLQTVQYHGNVAPDKLAANFPDWQRIYGDTEARKTRMQSAFTKIMQSGVQVSLLE